jgi:hypothetical protein
MTKCYKKNYNNFKTDFKKIFLIFKNDKNRNLLILFVIDFLINYLTKIKPILMLNFFYFKKLILILTTKKNRK